MCLKTMGNMLLFRTRVGGQVVYSKISKVTPPKYV